MNIKLKNREKGFTIIEVLIVLAIAGLIMLIVFLAIPSLQRNSRNTQRSSDAARITGAINECMTNNNGNLANCDTTGELTNYIDIASNQQLTVMITAAGPGTTSEANLNTGAAGFRCDNNNIAAGGGGRAYAIGYQVETRNAPVNRCIGS